ncbi:MAG: L,D-transpeptidase [Hahellaceae bacterium]|nr:L,D-transpeptidase [Hahellaceae bacterium]MCP5212088.1 L,D-transpeptidase [Hahellaceae bacterium]
MHSITIDTSKQALTLVDGKELLKRYPISTALNGLGEKKGSGCTPTGLHFIRAKIGARCESGSVFVGRRFTGEIYTQQLADRYPDRDWILSRILWLCGREVGKNRLADVDTMQRYIYIHGTPDTEPMGVPLSHGCIRMRNEDVIELFDFVSIGTEVIIC